MADELYQYLISPDAQVSWDMGSTQQSTKTLRNNLSRRWVGGHAPVVGDGLAEVEFDRGWRLLCTCVCARV